MKLGEFLKQFSHNNIIRLVYPFEHGGYTTVLPTWSDVSMDHDVLNQKGKNRHYINNEVIKLVSICVTGGDKYPEAINIVIEKLENQPLIDEIVKDNTLNGYVENNKDN